MSFDNHPTRYFDEMSSAVGRMERLARSASKRRDDELKAEFAGIAQDELLLRRELLNGLERLITDWKSDGSSAYDARLILAEFADQEFATRVVGADSFGPAVVYISLGPLPHLSLDGASQAYIEGLYFQPSYRDGKMGLELTFVCNEPGWEGLRTLRYGEALRIASRIATGFVEFGTNEHQDLAVEWIRGDPALLRDQSLVRAMASTKLVLGILANPNQATIQIGDVLAPKARIH